MSLRLPDHCGSLESDAPPVDVYVFRKSHGFKHFGTEHATVPHFYPFAKLGVEGEDFERWLRIQLSVAAWYKDFAFLASV